MSFDVSALCIVMLGPPPRLQGIDSGAAHSTAPRPRPLQPPFPIRASRRRVRSGYNRGVPCTPGGGTMSDPRSAQRYQSYRGLPTLAGVATLEQAAKPGLSIEACVTRLKRLHYAFLRPHETFTARITAEPVYELKTGLSHHAYLCSEHVLALRTRVGEMREPPLGLEVVPDPALEVFFDEILAAPTTAELLVGLYETALPALDAALERH